MGQQQLLNSKTAPRSIVARGQHVVIEVVLLFEPLAVVSFQESGT